jgi:hypothetical protein
VTGPETRADDGLPQEQEEPSGGETACALHRVCDACGALEDGPPQPVCGRCGSPRDG